MIRYCILAPTSKINLELSSVELRVFTKDWSWTLTTTDRTHWLWFNSREDANLFAQKIRIDNAIPYGVDINNYLLGEF